MTIPTILEDILVAKRQRLAQSKRSVSHSDLASTCSLLPDTRGFIRSLQVKRASGLPAVIAEVKRASPSQGVIRSNFNPPAIAQSYEASGAACLSVLTEQDFFLGDLSILKDIRQVCQLPLLRKDFIFDPYQVVEARANGADCILLIAAMLSDLQLNELNSLAKVYGLDVLIEVHNLEELERVLAMGVDLVGINNRNLHTFETRLETTQELLSHIPDTVSVVTESGIHTKQDVEYMLGLGVGSFLVGEAFMRMDNPGQGIVELFLS